MTTPASEDPGLFDLPLTPTPLPDPAAGAEETEGGAANSARRGARRRPPAPPPESLPLFGDEELPPRAGGAAVSSEPARSKPRPVPHPAPPESAPGGAAAGEVPAPLALRARAAAGDLVVLGAAAAVAALGARALGAPIGLAELAPLAVFLLAFSFLYSVISLAFWGQTPGMAWVGLVARTVAGEPLSFGQTALRWAGSWLTWATLGLAGLSALSGRSLADRVSGSATYALPEPVA